MNVTASASPSSLPIKTVLLGSACTKTAPPLPLEEQESKVQDVSERGTEEERAV